MMADENWPNSKCEPPTVLIRDAYVSNSSKTTVSGGQVKETGSKEKPAGHRHWRVDRDRHYYNDVV